jgi:hypothetical protein
VTGGWRKLHNRELHNLFTSNIIGMIKSREMGWTRHVVRKGLMKNASKIWLGSVKGRHQSEELD